MKAGGVLRSVYRRCCWGSAGRGRSPPRLNGGLGTTISVPGLPENLQPVQLPVAEPRLLACTFASGSSSAQLQLSALLSRLLLLLFRVF